MEVSADKIRDYFDYDSLRFADNRWLGSQVARKDYEITMEYLLQFLDLSDKDNVLEVGCGPGVWTDLVSRRCHRMTAVDISADMLTQARHRVQTENVIFRQANFDEYEDSESYDKIFSVRAIEYFPDTIQAVRNMYTMTREGGRVVTVTKTCPTLITVRAKLWSFVRRILPRKKESALEPSLPMTKIPPFRLRRLFLESGYSKADIYPVVLRAPFFVHGRYLLPCASEGLQQKYEMSMLRFCNRFAGRAKSAREIARYLLLIFSETYLVIAQK
jgi:SAM-dependent methyltransferase